MRDATTNAPICGSCGAVYAFPPLCPNSPDDAARAAGWGVFTGRTHGGVHVDLATCPACRKPAAAPDSPVGDWADVPLFTATPPGLA